MKTPEFLIWAIEYGCPIRGFQDGSDPERIERQLRAARAVSDARREGRVFEGLCVQPPDGFRIEDALAVYGGLAAVEGACDGCPANAVQQMDPQALAGCFGIVPLPKDESLMHAAIDRAIDRAGMADDVARLFPGTRPRWYGLWMHSPLSTEQAAVIERLLADVEVAEIGGNVLAEFLSGLQSARLAGLRVHHALYPRGVVVESRWQLAAHCPQCHAPWNSADRRTCDACGGTGRPAADRKRFARGKRPYYPLDRLLGPEQAVAFLIRYEASGALAGSPDREQTPLPEVRLDSPPGG